MTDGRPGVRETSVGAVVLAAGFGTRLAPLTDHTPKPLIKVGGRAVASHLVTLLEWVDPAMPIIVVTNGRHRDSWRRWADDYGSRVQLVSNGVTSVEQRFGAVADLAFGLAVLPPVERTIVVAGDNLILEPLGGHVAAAQALDAPIVLCRDLGSKVPPGRFGEVTADSLGRVTRFREKPSDPRSPLVATCTYVLPGSGLEALVEHYLREGDPDSPGRFIGWLAERQTVFARRLRGSYFDIGNHETLAAARAALGS